MLENKQIQKKITRTKLGDAPKNPGCAFTLFRKEVAPKVSAAEEHQGKKMSELSKEYKELWEKVPEELVRKSW